ncbi:MAG: glucose-6-phosphate isomerase [Verrucomicrobia bacterium]|nr:MAG: glucose-6-phosphate isomerase [Verrucomicrobiota bacterium]
MSKLWDRYQQYHLSHHGLGISLDVSRMGFSGEFLSRMDAPARSALESMAALEAGAEANPDEHRMVGHYWLRNAGLAPSAELGKTIADTNAAIHRFAAQVHESGEFTDVLVIGIGGSALGPQFISDALGTHENPIRLHFLDNTDPDGMDRVFESLQGRLDHTLTVVISKSGGTKETRNGMLEAKRQYELAGVPFGARAVAVTGDGSELDVYAKTNGWLTRFPMWDWVGGRTSVMSAVGMVPLMLQGIPMERLLLGAAEMDVWTRCAEPLKNPAMLLALMWHYAGNGKGEKDMVVLPYKDRLVLFSKYLQQLVMESLGKRHDLDGKEVHQGIAVYGNKGSTDQHAYVQQLRDGVHNFFVTFVEVRKDRSSAGFDVEPNTTTGDYLQGFLRGTRSALFDSGRESITVSLPEVSPEAVGALIALYERAVGFYGSLVHVNAYHQPGVEAGKKAASAVLSLQHQVLGALTKEAQTASEMGALLGADPEDVYHVLQHLSANRASVHLHAGGSPNVDRFSLTA